MVVCYVHEVMTRLCSSVDETEPISAQSQRQKSSGRNTFFLSCSVIILFFVLIYFGQSKTLIQSLFYLL